MTGPRKKIVRAYSPGLQDLEDKNVIIWNYNTQSFYNNVTRSKISERTALRYGRFYSKYSWKTPFSVALGLKKQRKRYEGKKWVNEASPSGIYKHHGKTIKSVKRKPSIRIEWRAKTPTTKRKDIKFVTDRMNIKGDKLYGYVRIPLRINVTSEGHIAAAEQRLGNIIYKVAKPKGQKLLDAYEGRINTKRWAVSGRLGIFITGFVEAQKDEPGSNPDGQLAMEEIKQNKIANPRWFNPVAANYLSNPGALDSVINDLYEMGLNAIYKIRLSYCKRVYLPEIVINVFNMNRLTKEEKRRARQRGIWD